MFQGGSAVSYLSFDFSFQGCHERPKEAQLMLLLKRVNEAVAQAHTACAWLGNTRTSKIF